VDKKLKMEELNRNTLTQALAQLPDYPPDASVWSAIDLQLSVGEMTVYEPPVSIWDNLEKQLDSELKTSLLGTKQTNEELRIDGATDNVSETFKVSETSDLTETSPLKVVKKKGVLRYLSFQKLAIAAAMTGLIFTVFNLLKPNHTEGSSLKYSTEVVDNQLLKNTSDDAEADYQMVENFCQQQIAACETPAFKTLKSELDELNSARETIKNAIGNYNSDADLMIQLKDIEQQRATILRQIVGVM
jgi:hypothetical protein